MTHLRGQASKMPGVHAFRGYASLLVVFCHAADAVKRFSADQRFDWMIEGGLVGVSFFFVLSGFIMGHIHGRDRRDLNQGKRFFFKRLVRVVPTYWVMTFAVFAALQFGGDFGEPDHHHVTGLLQSLFFVPTTAGPIVRVGWTLHHEILFYAVFGTALYVLKRPTLVMLLWTGAILFVGFGNALARPTGAGVHEGFFGLWTLFTAPLNLLFPIGLATVVLTRFAGNHLDSISQGKWLPWLTLAAALALLGATWAKAAGFGDHLSEEIRWWKPVAYGALSMLILGSVALPQIGRFLGGAGNVFLGDASYAIYLVHYYLIAVAGRVAHRIGLDQQPILFWIGLVTCSVVGGGLFHYLIEKPVTRWLGKRVPDSHQKAAQAK